MQRLEAHQYAQAAPVFRDLAEFHLSVDAVLAGTAPGPLWVDDIDNPRAGFVITSEGHYLAGDGACEQSYTALRAIIPDKAYLIAHSQSWEPVLARVWANRAARRHPRQYLRFQAQRLPHWRTLIPDGFQFVSVDQALLERTDLKNHAEVAGRMGDWHSADYFLQHGFGFCLLHGDTIVCRCIADCVRGDRCEIGIGTDMRYRRRGLAAIVVAGTVDYCLSHGFTQIGWHCLGSNAGSLALAERIGFGRVHEYAAYSAVLPAENEADLSPAEYAEWAGHYERIVGDSLWYRLFAAEAWALAGQPERALLHLRGLLEEGWHGPPQRLEDNWRFASIEGWDEYQTIIAVLTGGAGD